MKSTIQKITLATSLAAFLTSCSSTSTETDRDLFVQADSNKDGRLSLPEVNQAALPRLYSRFDVNGDGNVTLAEAREVEPGFAEKAFTERDLDKDGKVTFAESEKVALAKGGLKKQFAEVDTNKDGFVDKTEADAHVDKLEKQSAAKH
jgi:Ca2+-binding EF-hand superfamily protein